MVCQELIYHIKKTTGQTIKTTLAGVVFCFRGAPRASAQNDGETNRLADTYNVSLRDGLFLRSFSAGVPRVVRPAIRTGNLLHRLPECPAPLWDYVCHRNPIGVTG